MAIVKCPKCKKRYDPGTEDLDDMPDNMSVKVVCPACGQWARLPEGEAIPAPKVPPAILKSMKAQSRLLDDDEEIGVEKSARSSSPVITCPECNKQFKGKGDLKGKKIRCPFCREPFTVPAAEEGAPPPKPAAKKPPAKAVAKAPASKPAAGEDDDDPNPYGVTELDIAPRCPNCANEMASEEAVICLFCGYNTMTRTWGKTEKVIEMTGGEHFMWLLPGLACALTIVLLILFLIAYCVVIPYYSRDEWYEFADHESIRMWLTSITLSIIWGLGFFTFKRLVLNPLPPDKHKE